MPQLHLPLSLLFLCLRLTVLPRMFFVNGIVPSPCPVVVRRFGRPHPADQGWWNALGIDKP